MSRKQDTREKYFRDASGLNHFMEDDGTERNEDCREDPPFPTMWERVKAKRNTHDTNRISKRERYIFPMERG